jgi:hypothetical protein
MVALLAVLMLSSIAYASSVEVDGSYYSRGRYFMNPGQVVDAVPDVADDPATPADESAGTVGTQDPKPYSNYDHELDLWGQINVSDTTFVRFRFEIADEVWGTNEGDTDDNIELQRVWGGHTFGTGTKLEFGQMTGGAWAYSFGDTAGERYRVKVSQAIPAGVVVGILEKDAENGSDVEDSEKNDYDFYFLAAVLKAGALNIKPLLGYGQNGATDTGDDGYNNIALIDVGVDGVFGIVGFETEVAYKSYTFDEAAGGATPSDDYSLYGLYLDVYAQLDAIKPGIFFAYGSVDKDTGAVYSFGDDFDGHGAEMIGNEFAFGGTDAIGGATYVGAYCNFAASDALSFFGQIGYAKGNSDSAIEDDTAIDVSARGSYKITDALTYTIGAGYATVDRDAGDDPDPGYKLYHKMAIAF